MDQNIQPREGYFIRVNQDSKRLLTFGFTLGQNMVYTLRHDTKLGFTASQSYEFFDYIMLSKNDIKETGKMVQ